MPHEHDFYDEVRETVDKDAMVVLFSFSFLIFCEQIFGFCQFLSGADHKFANPICHYFIFLFFLSLLPADLSIF